MTIKSNNKTVVASNVMISILYEMSLYILAFIALPKMIYQRLFSGKYKYSFSQRFGIGFPKIVKGERKLVWIHAVSLGETKAVAALAKLIKQEYGNNPMIVISSMTETGHAEAKRCMGFADHHVYLPLDFHWIISPIVARAKPDLVILSETDFWYNFLKCCKANGSTTALVNGKLSERSLKRFQKFRSFAKSLFSLIDRFCVQNRLYGERFQQVGVPEDKIAVTGNLKFDDSYPKLSQEELLDWKRQLGIDPEDQVLIVGSSHDPEEEWILEALQPVWESFPKLKVMFAPRHPERFAEVSDLLNRKKIPFVRHSQLSSKKGHERVILIDAMGLLRKCYQIADIAIVAGSFTPRIGGHNIIEPCWYGVPVFFGPYMHTQPELVALVSDYCAGLQLPIEQLSETLLIYLANPIKRKELGQQGKVLVLDMQGSTRKTWLSLQERKMSVY